MLDYYQGDEIYYPSSDNEPMGENDVICWLMTASLDTLKRYFQSQDDVYVSSNSFLYYVEGDVQQRVAPDLYVVKGVSSRQRPNYKIWEESVVPQVVFEFTTASSRYKDLGVKKGLYEALGVAEYYLYDPAGEYLEPSFRAFHRENDVLVERPNKSSHFSPELQLTIRPKNQLLRFFPVDSLQPIPTSQELEALAEEQKARAEEQKAHAEEQKARAEEQKARAEEQQSRAERQTARADRLAGEVDELRAELARLREKTE